MNYDRWVNVYSAMSMSWMWLWWPGATHWSGCPVLLTRGFTHVWQSICWFSNRPIRKPECEYFCLQINMHGSGEHVYKGLLSVDSYGGYVHLWVEPVQSAHGAITACSGQKQQQFSTSVFLKKMDKKKSLLLWSGSFVVYFRSTVTFQRLNGRTIIQFSGKRDSVGNQ